ncbi:MAG: hypothetical protein AAF762_07915 [Pseudomonadota bacterium]
MADALKVAQNRRDEYKKEIAKKEAEIEELKELLSDLDSFIEFGEALVNDGDEKPAETASTPDRVVSKPVVSKPAVSRPSPQQTPQPVQATPVDDEWGADENKQGIARVLAARNG